MKFKRILAGVLSAVMVITGLPAAGGVGVSVSFAESVGEEYRELVPDAGWSVTADSISSSEGSVEAPLMDDGSFWHSSYSNGDGKNANPVGDGSNLTGNNNYYISLPESANLGALGYKGRGERTNGPIKNANIYVSNKELTADEKVENIQVSENVNDGWVKVGELKNLSADTEIHTAEFEEPTIARHVRIEAKNTYGQDGADNQHISAVRFILYSLQMSENVALSSKGTQVVAYSGEQAAAGGGSLAAANAIDGDGTTRWSANVKLKELGNDGGAAVEGARNYLILDLGKDKTELDKAQGMKIKWHARARGTDYQIKTSATAPRVNDDGTLEDVSELAKEDKWEVVAEKKTEENETTEVVDIIAGDDLKTTELKRYVCLDCTKMNSLAAAATAITFYEWEIYAKGEASQIDSKELDDAVKEADTIISEGNSAADGGAVKYTDGSWKALEAALAKAKRVLEAIKTPEGKEVLRSGYQTTLDSLKHAMESLEITDSHPVSREVELDGSDLMEKAFASSQMNPADGNDGPAGWAFNGETGNWWHTDWSTDGQGDLPDYVGTDFGKEVKVTKITYSGRTNSHNNWIKKYVLFLATNKKEDGAADIPLEKLVSDKVTASEPDLSELSAAGWAKAGELEVPAAAAEAAQKVVEIDVKTLNDGQPVSAYGFALVALEVSTAQNNHVTASAIKVYGQMDVPRTELPAPVLKVVGPKNESEPSDAAIVGADADYAVTETKWYKDGSQELGDAEKFADGSDYKVEVKLKASDGYRFLNGSRPKSILVGKTGSYEALLAEGDSANISEDQSEMTVTYTFKADNKMGTSEKEALFSQIDGALEAMPTEEEKEKYSYATWNIYKAALDGLTELKTKLEEDVAAGEYVPKNFSVESALAELRAAFEGLVSKADYNRQTVFWDEQFKTPAADEDDTKTALGHQEEDDVWHYQVLKASDGKWEDIGSDKFKENYANGGVLEGIWGSDGNDNPEGFYYGAIGRTKLTPCLSGNNASTYQAVAFAWKRANGVWKEVDEPDFVKLILHGSVSVSNGANKDPVTLRVEQEANPASDATPGELTTLASKVLPVYDANNPTIDVTDVVGVVRTKDIAYLRIVADVANNDVFNVDAEVTSATYDEYARQVLSNAENLNTDDKKPSTVAILKAAKEALDDALKAEPLVKETVTEKTKALEDAIKGLEVNPPCACSVTVSDPVLTPAGTISVEEGKPTEVNVTVTATPATNDCGHEVEVKNGDATEFKTHAEIGTTECETEITASGAGASEVTDKKFTVNQAGVLTVTVKATFNGQTSEEKSVTATVETQASKSLASAVDSAEKDYPAQGEWSTESWNRLQTALQKARDLMNQASVTDDELNKAVKEIQDALEGMETQVRADLRSTIAEAQEKITDSQYTAASRDNVKAEMDKAAIVLKNKDASKEELSAALNALRDAIGKLQTTAEAELQSAKTTLDSEIKKAKDILDKGKGTCPDNLWTALQAAYNAAVAGQESASVDELKKLQANLKTALENVQKAQQQQQQQSPPLPGVGTQHKVKKLVYSIKTSSATSRTVRVVKPVKNGNKKLTIPATVKIGGYTYNVTEIKASAFAKSKKLTQITIGKNVTTIGRKAFYGAEKLKNVVMKGQNVKKIGKQAFAKINKKAKLYAPKKMSKKKFNALKKNLKQAKTIKSAKILKK